MDSASSGIAFRLLYERSVRLNKHAKITNRVLTKGDRGGTVEESFGGCRGLESDETEALLAVSPANDARCCNRLLKKQMYIAQRAKGTSYPVTTLRVFMVTGKSHNLHDRKRLSRYKKEKSQSLFSKRVARVALRTCAPQPRGRAAMIAGTQA